MNQQLFYQTYSMGHQFSATLGIPINQLAYQLQEIRTSPEQSSYFIIFYYLFFLSCNLYYLFVYINVLFAITYFTQQKTLMKQMGSLFQFLEPPGNLNLNSRLSRQSKQHIAYSPASVRTSERNELNQKGLNKSLDANQQNNLKRKNKKAYQEFDGISMEKQSWKNLLQKYKANRYINTPINSFMMPRKITISELRPDSRLNIGKALEKVLEKYDMENFHSNDEQIISEQLQPKYSEKMPNLNYLAKQQIKHSLRRKSQIGSNREGQRNDSMLIKKKKDLSDTKRIQFELCLSWAKKHKKNSNFYEQQLGKARLEDDWNERVMKRKGLLSMIGQKSKIYPKIPTKVHQFEKVRERKEYPSVKIQLYLSQKDNKNGQRTNRLGKLKQRQSSQIIAQRKMRIREKRSQTVI